MITLSLNVCLSFAHADMLVKKINIEKLPIELAVKQVNTGRTTNCMQYVVFDDDIVAIEKAKVYFFDQTLLTLYKITLKNKKVLYQGMGGSTF